MTNDTDTNTDERADRPETAVYKLSAASEAAKIDRSEDTETLHDMVMRQAKELAALSHLLESARSSRAISPSEQLNKLRQSHAELLKTVTALRTLLLNTLDAIGECISDEEILFRIITTANLVDSEWYLAQNPDVEAAGASAEQHFCSFGLSERRAPNRLVQRTIKTGHDL